MGDMDIGLRYFPLYPIWFVDFFGSFAVIVLSSLCLRLSYIYFKKDKENAFANYLLCFFTALFAFGFSRSLGHMLKHVLHFAGYSYLWKNFAPFTGSFNTMTFFIAAAVTTFFQRMDFIISKMAEYRQKIQKSSQDLLKLNMDIEAVVTERTRAEMALRVAHELRNPAVIIGGLVKLAMKSMKLENVDRDRLEKVLDQAHKLEMLVGKFERLRGSDEMFIVVLELNGLVEECINIVQGEADRKGIVILWDRYPGALPFQGNDHLIRIAIVHILRNAMEACSLGNTIAASTSLGKHGIVVSIKDDGPGIPREILDHIFEAYYSTEKGATGLGLPYVRQIINEHKGEVRIESKEGKGTEVTIMLPTHLEELRQVA
jgi:signal transduction histidine kinase